MQKKWFDKGAIYKEAAQCHQQLREDNFNFHQNDLTVEKQNSNATNAQIIVEGFEKIDAIWQETDYFLKNKKLRHLEPTPTTFENLSIQEIEKVIKTRISNISTYKKRISKTKDTIKIRKMENTIIKFGNDIVELKRIKREREKQ